MYVVILVHLNLWKIDEASGKRSFMNLYRRILLIQFWYNYYCDSSTVAPVQCQLRTIFPGKARKVQRPPLSFFPLRHSLCPAHMTFLILTFLWGSLFIYFHMMLPCLSEVMESRNSRSNSQAHAISLSESALLEPRKLSDGPFDQSTY